MPRKVELAHAIRQASLVKALAGAMKSSSSQGELLQLDMHEALDCMDTVTPEQSWAWQLQICPGQAASLPRYSARCLYPTTKARKESAPPQGPRLCNTSGYRIRESACSNDFQGKHNRSFWSCTGRPLTHVCGGIACIRFSKGAFGHLVP